MKYIHIVEMENEQSAIIFSYKITLDALEIQNILEQPLAARRVAKTRLLRQDPIEILDKLSISLTDDRTNNPYIFNCTPQAVSIALDLLYSKQPAPISDANDVLGFNRDEIADFVAQFFNRANTTKHASSGGKKFGISSNEDIDAVSAATEFGLDHVFPSDILSRARCIKVCRSGDQIFLLGEATERLKNLAC